MATPRKWPGRAAPSAPVSPGSTQVAKPGGYSSSARRREHDVDSLRLGDREVARLVARVCGEIRLLVELRRIDEERHDDACGSPAAPPAAARRGRRGGLPSSGRARCPGAVSSSAIVRTTFMRAPPSPRRALVERLELGMRRADRRSCASTVAQSPRAIGPVSSKPLSIVPRISGTSPSAGTPSRTAARCSVTR